MKRTIGLMILLVALLGCYSQPAHAQFWKEWFKRKEKSKSKPKPAPKKPVVKEKPVVKKKENIQDYPASVKKDRYRVDVFAQLYLDELVRDGKPVFKGRIPEKAIQGLDFYEGLKLAADTLSNFGYSIDLYVHDITNPAEKPEALIAARKLENTDLVIGAVNAPYIPALANFAAKKKVNFVSALSPTDAGVRNNPYFILLQPSLQTHCQELVAAFNKKHKNKTPILLYRTNVSVDSNAYGYLDIKDGDAKKVLCNTMPSKAKLQPLLDSTKVNLLIVSILDNDVAEKLLYQLNEWFPQYDFEVYGMPSWKSMNSLRKPDAYPHVVVYITSPFYFDLSTGSGQAVAYGYKKDVGSNKPGEMVFRGYETLYWYGYLLNKYGNIFNDKLKDNTAAPFTRFDIKANKDRENNIDYHENTHLYLYRYQSSSYMIEQ